jgi:hypothetical protein
MLSYVQQFKRIRILNPIGALLLPSEREVEEKGRLYWRGKQRPIIQSACLGIPNLNPALQPLSLVNPKFDGVWQIQKHRL